MAVRSLNKVQLIGNLTRDPEVRYTGSGAAVATFSVATNRSWKNKDGEVQEAVEFHNIVAWSKLAEICQQLLKKGSKVYVEGSLTTRSWDDEETGKKNYKTEVRIDDLILLDSKGKPSDSEASASAKGSSEPMPEEPAEKKAKESKASKAKDEDPLEDLPF